MFQTFILYPCRRTVQASPARQILGALLLLFCASSTAAKDVTRVKHYDKGYSPLLQVYLTDVLRAALDKTEPEFGAYEIEFYSHYLSSNRSKIETERGTLLDVLFSTHWSGAFVNTNNVIQLEYPIFEGMLGLRRLIVTQGQYADFSQLQSRDDFLRFSAGQGSSWTDIEVLKANGIKVVESQLFDGLFPMLSKRRFDYLPLSILEAHTALQNKGTQFDNLLISDDVCLFYPMPFFLYVNAARPELAERLGKGLQLALNDGTVERLFAQHFHYIKPFFTEGSKKLVVLRNPIMSESENRAAVQYFLGKYENMFRLLP